MPTRKEILEQLRDNMTELSSTVETGAADVRATSDVLRDSALAQAKAGEKLAKSIQKAGHDVVGAAVVGSFGALVAQATSREVQRINSTTDMITSVLLLQSRHERLTYDFIIERSYVKGANRDQKQNALNELILGGLVESEETEDGERFFIDVESPLLEWWQAAIEALKAGESPPPRPVPEQE